MHFFYLISGSSGDELDSSQELPTILEVPPELQVIPLNNLHQDPYMDQIKVISKK